MIPVLIVFGCFCVASAGAGRTGTFIALSNILERVKAEGLLDVFQTVKSLRMQRPHMVQTMVGVVVHTEGVQKQYDQPSSLFIIIGLTITLGARLHTRHTHYTVLHWSLYHLSLYCIIFTVDPLIMAGAFIY